MVPRWGFSFFAGGLHFFLGHFHGIFNISTECSAQAQSIGTLFEHIGLRGGGSVDMSKSQRHKRSGAGRGLSQANGAAIHSKLLGLCQHKIISGILKNESDVGLCKPEVGAW